MVETTNAPQNQSKTAKPRTKKQSPVRNTRQELLDRIVEDMIYKTATPEQRKIWTWIATTFNRFQREARHLFNYSEVPNRLVDTSEFFTYAKELRRAERWANSAVANDWTDNSDFDTEEALPMQYPVEPGQGGTGERHKLCDEVSRMTFELDTLMAQYLPEGRHLSLFATQMQVVRGALMDTINDNVAEVRERAKQGVTTNVQP